MTKERLIDHMQEVLLPVLCAELKEEDCFMTLEVNAVSDKEWGHDDAEAYVTHETSMFCCEELGVVFSRDFEIEYKSILEKDEMIFRRMICLRLR